MIARAWVNLAIMGSMAKSETVGMSYGLCEKSASMPLDSGQGVSPSPESKLFEIIALAFRFG